MKTIILSCACLSFGVAFAQEAATSQSPFIAIAPPATASGELVFSAPVPQFEARDLNGRIWRATDLLGRVTVVQVWATFCLPCRQEHPMLQNFVSRLPETSNVQVLTFSIDEDASRAMAYLNDKGYRFPVIVDADMEQKLFSKEGGIPRTYVIDSRGYMAEPPQSWTFGRTLAEAQKLAASTR